MKTLLVANRGEIARRVFRTARAMGLRTVAVFSDADQHAPHVAEADLSVRLDGGNAPAQTYLNIDKILAAARSTGADAIHPGYGFLSENAAFARACADAGFTFIGPSPDAIEAMGSKIAAKSLMAAAGVPVLPGGTPQEYSPQPGDFPLLVKAAFGGGGRGMRIVRDHTQLESALEAAAREAASAFGDGAVFLERYVEDPRHIEVQIFGDLHGNVIHLFERECSIQRRYQKIIEEAPSPAVDETLRTQLCAAAVAAGRTLNYVGAGTVEFVLDASGRFYFLEVNTRLQVEHPVTEMVTGLDLVELQLRVARGEPLAPTPTLRGHAIEARLYAEDVPAGFIPTSGRIDHLSWPGISGTRIDSGYENGSTVSTHYDAMLAKVIAHAESRTTAAQRLADTLAGAVVRGPITNRDLLVAVLTHPDFLAGATDTGFLERHADQLLAHVATDPVAAVAAALAAQAERRATAPVQHTIPSGWRNVPTAPQRARYAAADGSADVDYAFTREGLDLSVNGERLTGTVLWDATTDRVDLTVAGVRRTYTVERTGGFTFVDGPFGHTRLTAIDPLPEPGQTLAAGSTLAPMPGSVTRVFASIGDRVDAAQPLVVLEAMKMEHTVTSPSAGVVSDVRVGIGDQVNAGQILVIVEADTDA